MTTLGLAAPLAAGGVTLTMTGGVTSMTASVTKFLLEKHDLKKAQEKWDSFKRDCAEAGVFSVVDDPAAGSDDVQLRGLPTEPWKKLEDTVRRLLEAFRIFFKPAAMEEMVRHQLKEKGEQFVGLRAEDTVRDTLSRFAQQCGVSMDDLQKIAGAMETILKQLKQPGLLDDLNDLPSMKTEDLLDVVAKHVASMCTVTPDKVRVCLEYALYRPEVALKVVNLGVQTARAAQSSAGWWMAFSRPGVSVASTSSQAAESAWSWRGAYQYSSSVAGRLAETGTNLAKSTASYLPQSLTGTGSAAASASRSTAASLMRQGQGLVAAGRAWLPGRVVEGGRAAYSASSSLASGVVSSGRNAAAWATRLVSGGGKGVAAGGKAALGGGGGGMTAVTSVGRSVVVLNAVFLPLSVYDLITLSAQLHQEKKSPAGDVMRQLAEQLYQGFCRDG